jgi:hypothetical protein
LGARADIDAAREAYLRHAFPGNSQAATAMRGFFTTRLAVTQPIDPKAEIGRLFAEATANSLNIDIVSRAKELATARNAQQFSQTQFAKDRDRVFDVFLPDGSLLSTDPTAAADQLARFVLGREDAVYAQLAGAERTKVQVVMSLLVQQSSSAVIEMPATALDPEGKRAPFSYGGNGGGLTRSFRLERDAAGGITVRFETTVRPTNLIVEGDAIPLGVGSSISGSYALTLSAEKLNALGELDFANCDNAAANQVMDGNGEQKLRTAVNRLPPDFRLDLTPTTSFSAVLN